MDRRKAITAMAASGFAALPAVLSANGKEPAAKKSTPIIYASETGAKLDADVLLGGGTDDTAPLQAVLDSALETGGIYLVMDGAARITGLTLHANTTIACLNDSCGFFLSAQSNCAIVSNKHWVFSGERKDNNITLIGGTYNHNCKDQEHHVAKSSEQATFSFGDDKWVFGIEFYGVENLNIQNIIIRDQRTFALVIANWRYVNMENIRIDLDHYLWAQNQDGIHAFGPGEFLTIKNITGNSGDDFIALAPDEWDHVSSIRNVVIDGVFLNGADQGIRLLSRAKGRLDQVTIKNVMGSYKSFGFYIDHWFDGDGGDYGSITIDHVNLKQLEPNYHYTKPFLFRIAGKFENLTLKNIILQHPMDGRSMIDVGWPEPDDNHKFSSTYVKSLVVDGVQVLDDLSNDAETSYIKINTMVDRLIIRNIEVLRSEEKKGNGQFIDVYKDADIKTLFMYNVYLNSIRSLICNRGTVGLLKLNNVLGENMSGAFIREEGGGISQIEQHALSGADLR